MHYTVILIAWVHFAFSYEEGKFGIQPKAIYGGTFMRSKTGHA